MGGNWATGYALRPIPAHRKKRTIHLLQNRTFLFTSDSKKGQRPRFEWHTFVKIPPVAPVAGIFCVVRICSPPSNRIFA